MGLTGDPGSVTVADDVLGRASTTFVAVRIGAPFLNCGGLSESSRV